MDAIYKKHGSHWSLLLQQMDGCSMTRPFLSLWLVRLTFTYLVYQARPSLTLPKVLEGERESSLIDYHLSTKSTDLIGLCCSDNSMVAA